MTARISASHMDLVECPPVAAFTTVMPDGYPQTSVVWCDFDGTCVRVNTMRGFQKERNMRRNDRVTLLCYDPRQPLRFLEVRGAVVEMTEDGAAAPSGRARVQVPRQAGPLLRRCDPGAVRRDRDPGAVPGPADARRRTRCDGRSSGLMTAVAAADAVAIPPSHVDLLTRAICGVLTTMLPSGQPQSRSLAPLSSPFRPTPTSRLTQAEVGIW